MDNEDWVVEQYEKCGTCRYHRFEKQDCWICANQQSEMYGSYTEYDDTCDDYWER